MILYNKSEKSDALRKLSGLNSWKMGRTATFEDPNLSSVCEMNASEESRMINDHWVLQPEWEWMRPLRPEGQLQLLQGRRYGQCWGSGSHGVGSQIGLKVCNCRGLCNILAPRVRYEWVNPLSMYQRRTHTSFIVLKRQILWNHACPQGIEFGYDPKVMVRINYL
jgi:hypothetical protein